MRSQSTIWKLILFVVLILTIVTLVIRGNYYDKAYVRLLDAGIFHEEVPLERMTPTPGTMIALTFGQSNSANSAETLYTPHNPILNYAKGKLYVAKDPMLGASGLGGSVWGILGDRLVDSGLFKKVVFIPIGIGSTTISCWADSSCNEKLIATLKALQKNKIVLTHILWHQGEEDGNTTKAEYKKSLGKIVATIRSYGQQAPFYCSLASYNTKGVHLQILEAQKEFIDQTRNVLIGSRTDAISDPGDRFQQVHFSAQGMRKYADSWYKAIKNSVE
jgi:hypothetical protein